jgi:hypothetical protein
MERLRQAIELARQECATNILYPSFHLERANPRSIQIIYSQTQICPVAEIVEDSKTEKEDLQRALGLLQSAPMIGTVLNRSDEATYFINRT